MSYGKQAALSHLDGSRHVCIHVYVLTSIPGDGGEGRRVTDEKPAKPETTVRDWVSTSGSLTPHDILKRISGQLPAMFVSKKKHG